MKKIKYILVLILFIFSTTGCVKMNADMEIKATKEMIYKVTYAVDTTVFGDEDLLDEDEKKEIKNNGFEIEKFKDGNYVGYTFTKKIKNIDDVSTTKKIDSELLAGIDSEAESKYLFTVKKGFLKNTYTANFNFDSSEYDLDSGDDDYDYDYDDDDYDYDDDDYDYSDDDYDLDDDSVSGSMAKSTDDDMDFSNMYSNLDVKYTVKLPYGAKSSNATSKDGKKLTWDLMNSNFKGIEYEFEVYNLPVVIGLIIVILAAIGGGVFFFIKKKKGKTTATPAGTQAVTTAQPAPAQPTEPYAATPVQPAVNTTPVTPQPTPIEPTPVTQPAQPVTPTEAPVVSTQPTEAPVEPTPTQVATPVVNNEPTGPVVTETPVVNNEPSGPIVNDQNNIG